MMPVATTTAATRCMLVLTVIAAGLAALVERQLSQLDVRADRIGSVEAIDESDVDAPHETTTAALPATTEAAYQRLLQNNPFPKPAPSPPKATTQVDAPPAAVAVVMAPGRGLVLLEIEGEERPVRAGVGDDVAGWTILEITRNAVTLETEDGDLSVVPLKPPRKNARVGPAAPSEDSPDEVIDSIPAPDENGVLVWTPEALKKLVNGDDR